MSLCTILQTIPTLSLKQRKELLGLTRTQSPVVKGSYLESTLNCLYDPILVPSSIHPKESDVKYVSMCFGDFIKLYRDSLLSPIPCSIIALAVRISPTTTVEEYLERLNASVFKEVSASINRFHGATLDYRCIFSSDMSAREIPFSDRLPPNPEVASDTYTIFCRLREQLHNKIFFPSTGTKTVGDKVAHSFWTAYQASGCTFKHEGRFDHEDCVSPRDCLKLYEQTGGYVDGPVEVRCAWTYNQIDPRVYFARGGTVLQYSQYIQPIVNAIIDAFPEVHRVNRFSAPKAPLEDDDVEIIYDYGSFTSSLDHVVGFVGGLSMFMTGVIITIIDVRHGPIRVDLGELFAEYNKMCNEYASFDTNKILDILGEDSPILQHTCGMLGVEGNIFLATLLHGLHLRFISGLSRSRCVGDDARFHHNTGSGKLSTDDKTLISWMLTGIGVMNIEKMGVFESGVDPELQAYRYVKRPLQRDQDIMLEGLLFDIPSLLPVFDISDGFHTLRPSSTHPCRTSFKSIIRLLRTLKMHSISCESDEEGISMLAAHVRHLILEIRRLDPDSEHSPFSKSDIQTCYRLPRINEWGKIDYEDWLLADLGFETEVRFLKCGGAEDDGTCDGRYGSEMIRESSIGRSFLEKMGYLAKEDLFDTVSIAMIGLDRMREYLEGTYRSVCKYTVIETIPQWYTQIPRIL